MAILLLNSRGAETSSAALLASVAIVLSVPWIVPATMLLAVLSAPVYMWLHTQGPVPAVLDRCVERSEVRLRDISTDLLSADDFSFQQGATGGGFI